jgi:hypothetical protein
MVCIPENRPEQTGIEENVFDYKFPFALLSEQSDMAMRDARFAEYYNSSLPSPITGAMP